MLEDYCQKLQQLNKDKNDFLKLKYKSNAKSLVDKQENKYHKYILGQISHKNKLDALLKITQILNHILRHSQKPAFDKIIEKYRHQSTNIRQFASFSEQNLTNSVPKFKQTLHQQQNNTISKLKSKLKSFSCVSLVKLLQSHKKNQQFLGFKSIKQYCNLINSIQTISNFIQRKIAFQKNVFFYKFLSSKPKSTKKIPIENRDKSFIFSLNEFSEIIPYTIQQESQELSTSGLRNIQEIDNKFHPQSHQKLEETNLLQSQQNQHKLMFESFQKLKEEVIMMKNLLSQKNKQLKLKDEQIYKTKKEYEKKIQNLHDQLSNRIQKSFLLKDGISSKSFVKSSKKIQYQNDSYLKQLQNQIIGDRSPRGNLSEDDNVRTQLLQKYMRESFEIREKMDMARQMCEQFQFDQKTQQGQVMIQIIKLLTPQQRLNAIVD